MKVTTGGTTQEQVEADERLIKDKAEKFTNMIWKASTEVGFGIKGRFVIAWYCEDAGNEPSGYGPKWKENVARDCDDDGVNTCYVEHALKEHNKLRAEHRGGGALLPHESASRAIQREMDRDDFDGTPISVDDRGVFRECGQNVFTETSTDAARRLAVTETDVATKAWYAGQAWYDFDTGTPRVPKNNRSAADDAKVKLAE